MMKICGGWLCLFLLLSACGGGEDSPDGGTDLASGDAGGGRDSSIDAGPAVCGANLDCDDGIFCNGAETCSPSDPLAGVDGCVPAPDACLSGQICDEDGDSCLTECDLTGDADGDGHDSIDCGGDDCDDADALRYPGNVEVCDAANHDEDCDPESFGNKDLDGDGVVDASCCNARADGSEACGADCDDLTRTTHPTSPEVCDGRDNDCNGMVDDGVRVDGFADMDGDLHGDPAAPLSGCPGDGRFASAGDDCDDSNARLHPGQVEVCDGLDDDCNGLIDDGTGATDWYIDSDGDGYGDGTMATVSSCRRPAGHSLLGNDCDDSDPGSSPGAVERCDALDDDCDGRADFEIGAVGSGDFEDDDHDGYPDAACASAGTLADCDDTDPFAHPGAAEVCGDGVDNDCDGSVDTGCAPADWYPDADGDGWGDATASPTPSMTAIEGSVTRGGDCDDSRVDVNPAERDVCDGLDNDCDGLVDGSAGRHCGGVHAIMVCRTAACEVFECQRGFGDCRGDSGCETDITASPTDCGACGNGCFDGAHGLAACVDSACDLSCTTGYANCDGVLDNGCEIDTVADMANCGRCGNICSARPHASPTCTTGICGIVCDAGWANCDGDDTNGCEVNTARDAANCGGCGASCSVAGDVCVSSSCTANPFPSDGSEGAFAPTANVVLPAGAHQFTTIDIPAGVTVTTDGVGLLDLRATGDVNIDGVINVSGGDGADGGSDSPTTTCNGACGGGGGETGTGRPGQPPTGMACGAPGTGGGGVGGGDGSASMAAGTGSPCRAGGANGGGVGAPGGTCRFAGGAGGGGGYAGGGGGACPGATGGAGASSGAGDVGGSGASAVAGGCGIFSTPCVDGGHGGLSSPPYAGSDGHGPGGQSGGGGGSIGANAASDLSVASSFRAGSGGGGGGAPDLSGAVNGGGGGGGGGGALRIASPTSLTLRGRLLANGGGGGRGASGNSFSGGGGGGSGGVIYLAAPIVSVQPSASISAVGGSGGLGGSPGAGTAARGGDGGLGRIRVMTLPAECTLEGALSPPAIDRCAETRPAVGGKAYVGLWPN